MKNKSYIKELFVTLGAVVTLAVLLIGTVIFFYAKLEIEKELFFLNKNSLKQIGQVTKIRLEEYNNLSDKIASNSKMIDLLKEENKDGDAIEETMQRILDNYVWTYSEFNSMVYTYVLANDGTVYTDSISREEDFGTLTEIVETEIAKDWEGEVKIYGPIENKMAKGVYRYTFLVIRKIKDHITGENCGYVVLNISEKNLFESYRNLIAKDKNFYVVDENGIIVSSKNKQRIGQFCGVNIREADDQETSNEKIVLDDDGIKVYFLYYKIYQTGWYLVETIDTSALLTSFRKIQFFIAGILTVVTILLWLILKICLHAISKPVMEIKVKMGEVADGNMQTYLDYQKNNEFGEMAVAFNSMVERLEESRLMIKEEEKKKRLAEQDFLRAQINPHFIYNTLSSIRFFVEMKKNREAEEMLLYFSKILRKSLSYSNEFVSLKTELETVENYVKLQEMRYKNMFVVEYNIPEEILHNLIPVFILQPILENAIFHGMVQGKICHIVLKGYEKEEKIFLIIKDNGNGIKPEDKPRFTEKVGHMSKVGIHNVHDRIQLNFGAEYGLQVDSKEGEGTTVTFILPINKEGTDA